MQNYILYKMERKENGKGKRSAGKVCKNLDAVAEALAYLELMHEDVVSLADMVKVLKAIHAEVKRISEIQQSYAYA